MRIMKTKTAGLMFVVAGMVFLVGNAIQYLSGASTARPFAAIGIALVVIGVGIARSGKKTKEQ